MVIGLPVSINPVISPKKCGPNILKLIMDLKPASSAPTEMVFLIL